MISDTVIHIDSSGPLPPNWEAAYSENGEKYFIDHNKGTTQWEDPRIETDTISEAGTSATAIPTSAIGHEDTKLPPGWERVDDEVHGTFYVDHINKRTQYEAPPNSQPQQDLIPPKIMNSNFDNSPLYGKISDPSSSKFYGYQCNQDYYSQKDLGSLANGARLSNNENTPTAFDNNYAFPHHYNNGHANGGRQNGAFQGDEGVDYSVWQKSAQCSQSMQGNNFNNESNGLSTYMTSNGAEYGVLNGAGKRRGNIPYIFTNEVERLCGELLTTVIQKGPNGLGFTLIGNDGSSSEPEFIQIKTILPNGPAARNNVLEPGDVLVYVNDDCMLGASQDDACRTFRSIPPGESVRVKICRGYPYPASKIYTVSTNFQARSRENIEVDLKKGPTGFGFTITDSLQGQRVKTVLYPDLCSNLTEGDIILEVNGQHVRSLAHAKLVEMFKEFPPGSQLKMIVSRNTGRHRSRTPTAGFRYGEQRQQSTNAVVAPRSKTPAPTSSTANGKMNGANAAAFNRSLFQQQQRPFNYENPASWSTTMPRMQQTKLAEQDPNETPQGIYHNPQIRNSSTSLGFSSTPNYMPISALGIQNSQPSVQSNAEWQFLTVNLIEKDGGFGFHLLSEELNSPLVVGNIVPGGAARLDGRLQTGDEIVEIDGQPASNINYSMAVNTIKQASNIGRVKMVVKRKKESNIYGSYGVPSASIPNSSFNGESTGTLQRPSQTQNRHHQRPYEVHLTKLDQEEFGITIISQNHRYIGTISPQSPADRCGRLRPGDCVIAINGFPIFKMTHPQVVNFIRSSGNTITLTIDPNSRMTPIPTPTLHPAGINNMHQRVGDETIDSLVSMMTAATNGYSDYGTLTKNNGAVNGNRPIPAHEDTLLHVKLARGTKGFGFSIRGGMEFDEMPLFILRIADDGPAAADSRLKVGDQLVEINGEHTAGMTHSRAIELITQNPIVHLTVVRKADKMQ